MLCILLTILQCLSHSPKFLCAYLTGYQGKTFLRQALLPDFDIALQTLYYQQIGHLHKEVT